MNTLKLMLVLFFALSFSFINATSVTIDGYVYLENQDNPGTIHVRFERMAPSPFDTTVLTDTSGYYSCALETGIYRITYTKTGFIPTALIDQALYSNTTMSTLTLKLKGRFTLVPTDVPAIQTAIDFSLTNDTIIVEPGVYYENINFHGKNIVLSSTYLISNDTSIISSTIIDGNYKGHVVTFNSGEGSNCKLIGFKITHGKATAAAVGGDYWSTCGGGIYCMNSRPELVSLLIDSNYTIATNNGEGAGIYLYGSNAKILNCIIKNNVATGYDAQCGGISMNENSNAMISNCTIESNSKSGIYSRYNPYSIVRNSIIKNNSISGIKYSSSGGLIENSIICDNKNSGIDNYGEGTLIIKNSGFFNNSPRDYGGGAIFTGASDSLSVSNCIFANNLGGSAIYNFSPFPSDFVKIQYSDFYNNTDGDFYNCNSYLGQIVTVNTNGTPCDAFTNIFIDPALNPDNTLQSSSPCIDAGLNSVVNCTEDILNNSRIVNGNGDATANVDMGAFEFGQNGSNGIKLINNITGDIKIYPNPVESLLFIESKDFKVNGSGSVSIYNIEGREIIKQSLVETKTILDLSNLSNGIYFIRVLKNGDSLIKKFIKI